jgi:hypothetical protein
MVDNFLLRKPRKGWITSKKRDIANLFAQQRVLETREPRERRERVMQTEAVERENFFVKILRV